MGAAVGDAVGCEAVAGGDEDRDAQGAGVLDCTVQRSDGLSSVTGFWTPPRDRNHGRVIGGVVRRLADGVREALVGVGSEVDDDVGTGCVAAGNLNVERHLAVGVAAGTVGRAVDAYGGDCGSGQAHGGKGLGVVSVVIAAAELDERDVVTGAVNARREVVEWAELVGQVGGRGGRRARDDDKAG